MAENHDFKLDQGVTRNRTIAIAKDGVPVNLTGYTGGMKLRRNKSQNKVNLNLTTETRPILFKNLGYKKSYTIRLIRR